MRAFIVSGNHQVAHAYVAPAATTYFSQFSKPVVVRVDGPPVSPEHPWHVVFTCVSPNCTFAGAEQHELYDYTNRAKTDDGKEIANAYDARAHDGRAGIYVVIQAPVPAGTYTIRALPVVRPGERAVPAWFTLRTR
ncbi:MAG TPA: hypothetical protein VHT53_03830 [Candidatus Elarobacter sp.]|nr:hypothetical protein [Candidatus Elarobacter sp.]